MTHLPLLFSSRLPSRPSGRPRPGLVVLALTTLLVGCREAQEPIGEDGIEPLVVLAASSLRAVVPPLVEEYERRTGTPVVVVYGSSSGLAVQIESGAPADLFLSADEATVDRLVVSGGARAGTRSPYARGRLVLRSGEGVPPLPSLEALLRPEYRVIAIANPRTAPYGSAAAEALRSAGLLDELAVRLVHAESVADAYQLVRTGNADAAFIAASLLTSADEVGITPIDADLYSPLIHVAVVPSSSLHPDALDLLDFIGSDAARTILSAGGLEPVRS